MSSSLIKCRFCGKRLKFLNNLHLKSHGLVMSEYCELFPDQKEFQSEETRRKVGDSTKGVAKPPFTEEHKHNIGLAQRGKVVSKETRQRISDSTRGIPHPWSQGDNHPFRRISGLAKRVGEKRRGIPRPEISGDNHPMRKDPELAKRHGDLLRGKPQPWNAGSNSWTRKPENAEKLARMLEKTAQSSARDQSQPEKDLHWVLDELNLTWRKRTLSKVTAKGVTHVFDAVVEACNVEDESFSLLLALECDGCYWHGCEKCTPGAYEKSERVREAIDRDRLIDLTCYELGIPILRFWEHDMKNLPYVMAMIVHALGALQIRKVRMLKADVEGQRVMTNGDSN